MRSKAGLVQPTKLDALRFQVMGFTNKKLPIDIRSFY